MPNNRAACQYQGYEFGATYPDSMCIDGQLYDADDCDGAGNLYEPMEYVPCPMCHRDAAIRWHAERLNGPRKACRRAAKRLVKEIRAHRKPDGSFVDGYFGEVAR